MMSMLVTLSVCAAALVSAGLVWPLTGSKLLAAVAWLALALLLQYRTALQFGGLHAIISPDGVPTWAVVFFLWTEAFVLAAAALTVPYWVLRLCHVPLPGWGPAVPLALAAFCGIFTLWQGKRLPVVREETLLLRDLPAEAEGLRVAVVADLHLDQWVGRRHAEAFVRQLNELGPDLVLFTGDQCDGTLANRREALAPLADIEAPCFAVSGNHEWYFDGKALLAAYEALGLRMLEGRKVTIRGLTLIGVPDQAKLVSDANDDLLDSLCSDLPQGACTILLSHKPRIARHADGLGIDLQLSGHTHGGQFPLMDRLIARYNGGLVRGWYTMPRGLKLLVAPGSGTWIGFPFRFWPVTLPVLTLRRAP